MKRSTLTIAFSLFALACIFCSSAQAQISRNIRSGFGNRPQNPVRSIIGNPNSRRVGGLPLRDRFGFGNVGNHRIRNHKILSDGSLQWVPNRDPALNRVIPQSRPQPIRSPFAAGPTVGGRFRIQDRPRPQFQQSPQNRGWQTGDHVPLDGSQPWLN